MVFRRKRGTDFELRVEAANPKNSDFPQEKCIFSRNAQKRQFEAHNQINPQNPAKTWPEINDFQPRF